MDEDGTGEVFALFLPWLTLIEWAALLACVVYVDSAVGRIETGVMGFTLLCAASVSGGGIGGGRWLLYCAPARVHPR